ncbi:hypothetical protein H0B56_06430 [Haloechinothrix sp. YIM 98757]|uniref:Secreted protein n=1 Tax=Haloechinothrix aidingensis TaxID=2752311 RepID=A0A838A1Y6_9PSEU|nr:hypothetical protein [Haloechinothrix aidingensis]MBA0125173.1 hypothetical protein [Haloechinothrix aidingensis]
MAQAIRNRIAVVGACALVTASLTGMTSTTEAIEGASQPPEASASPVSSASVGSVDAEIDGQRVRQDPIAPCEVDGQSEAESGAVSVDRVASFGRGSSRCRRDTGGTGAAEAETSGRAFTSRVLRKYGGPILRVSSYSAGCRTVDSGSEGSVELRGVRGIDVPSDIPSNHAVLVHGPDESQPPLARVVVNEMVTPSPPDGSMTLNAMRIELFPEGGPDSGEIVVGSVSCDPFG